MQMVILLHQEEKFQEQVALYSLVLKNPFSKARAAQYDIMEFIPSMVVEGFEILQK